MAQRALCSKMAAVAGVTLALGLECGGGGGNSGELECRRRKGERAGARDGTAFG